MTVKIVFLHMTTRGIMGLLHGTMVTAIEHSDMFARFIKKVRDQQTTRNSKLGWFTAYLANVLLTKLQDQILPRRSRDRINPKL